MLKIRLRTRPVPFRLVTSLAAAATKARKIQGDEMKYRFHHIQEAPRDRVEEFVRTKSDVLQAQLETFEDDLVRLDARLDYQPKRYADRRNVSNFGAHLVLYMHGGNLPNIASTGHGESWIIAFSQAFEDLEVQLEKLLAKLHREIDIHAYQHRPSWEREGAEMLAEPPEPPARPASPAEGESEDEAE